MAEQPGVGKILPRHLIYFADPMCSWCWGFSTVIDHILRSFSQKLSMRLVMGGLRPSESEPMSDDDKARTRLHWEQVEAASAQTFSFDFFQRNKYVNNTAKSLENSVFQESVIGNALLNLALSF